MILDYQFIAVLVGALLFDIIFGEMPNAIHPVVWMGSYIKFLWGKRFRSSNISLFVSGVIILFSGMIIFSISTWLLIKYIPLLLSIIISIFLLTTVFSFKALIKAGKEVREALASLNIEKARELTGWHLVSRDVSSLNEEEIVSAVIESLAENITDGFTSPLLFFSIGGIPAAWGYRFVNTSDSLIAYRKDDYEWGGKMTAWVDTIFNWLPSRITGLIICIASFILREDWKNSFKVMKNQHRRTSSPNAGWTMGAMAGALGIKLEKKGDYLLDGGSGKRMYQLIDRAIKIVTVSMIIIVLISILLLEVISWMNI